MKTATSLVAAGGGAALGYAWLVEPHWTEIVRREMPIAGLPASWQGRNILQLSDLHVGGAEEDYLCAQLRRASTLDYDLVVITGDVTSYGSPEQFDKVERVLDCLRRPRLGAACSFGNHEYGENWVNARAADALEKRLDARGMFVLRNAAHDFDGLHVVGLDDWWGPRFDRVASRRLLGDAAERPAITLCHNPDVCDLPVWNGYRSWVLAGHTHGGQCRPPFLPAPLVPIRNKRYAQGEIALDDGRTLYVNRGLGYTRRIRFNVRPEVTLFTLTLAGPLS